MVFFRSAAMLTWINFAQAIATSFDLSQPAARFRERSTPAAGILVSGTKREREKK